MDCPLRAKLMPRPLVTIFAANGRSTSRRWEAQSLVTEKHPLAQSEERGRFEAIFLPHLSAAYNLAHWLARDRHDAEDVVQEAYLRAFRSFDSFVGENGRAWFLAIVRNTCLTWLKRSRPPQPIARVDETMHAPASGAPGPDRALIESANRELLHRALEAMPIEFREAIVLRELEGLSYKEIAAIASVPIGTVMSRLARGRTLLRDQMASRQPEDI
jgi:RNA polymerase sigma-70 factor, ECF subfamily